MAKTIEFMHFVSADEIRPQIECAFLAEREAILQAVPGVDVQHNGSSAVPGSLTKGDLDMQVRVPECRMAEAVAALAPRYHVNHPDMWTPRFALYERYEEAVPVGVAITAIGSEYDTYHVVREVFKRNGWLRDAYNAIKRAHEGLPEPDYRKAKDDFFKHHRDFIARYVVSPCLLTDPDEQ